MFWFARLFLTGRKSHKPRNNEPDRQCSSKRGASPQYCTGILYRRLVIRMACTYDSPPRWAAVGQHGTLGLKDYLVSGCLTKMAQHQRAGLAHTKTDQIDLPGLCVVQYLLRRMTGIHDHFEPASWINLWTKQPPHLLAQQLFTSLIRAPLLVRSSHVKSDDLRLVLRSQRCQIRQHDPRLRRRSEEHTSEL